jgi:hypothetical protein
VVLQNQAPERRATAAAAAAAAAAAVMLATVRVRSCVPQYQTCIWFLRDLC